METFGRYCSIAVGLWTIIAIFKALCFYINGLFLVKKLTKSHKQAAKYALSLSYYLLKNFNKEKTQKAEIEIQKLPIVKNSITNDQPETNYSTIPSDNQHPFGQLEELRQLNKILPTYKPNISNNTDKEDN